MPKPDKRNEILRAALELFVEQGFHGAPTAIIAERAGVGAGTVFRYFETKDILINELYLEIEKHFASELQSGYSPGIPFRKRFFYLGTAILQYTIAYPLHFRYLEQFHNSPYGANVRRDSMLGKNDGTIDMLKELFEEGVSQQILKELPLDILFALFLGPLTFVARDNNLGFIQLDETMIQRIIEAGWDAIKR